MITGIYSLEEEISKLYRNVGHHSLAYEASLPRTSVASSKNGVGYIKVMNREVKGRRAVSVEEGEERSNKVPYMDRLSADASLAVLFDDLLRWSTNSICFVED